MPNPVQYRRLAIRNDMAQSDSNLTPMMLKLLITLLVLFIITTLLVIALFVLRTMRRRSSASSRLDNEKVSSYTRLTDENIQTPAYAIQEKRGLMENSADSSPVPEIHITFPDEVDKTTGRPQSGRVVVVRLGENSAVGLEPMEDQLPPYQKEGGKFQSLDLERMGGLKEKELEKRYS